MTERPDWNAVMRRQEEYQWGQGPEDCTHPDYRLAERLVANGMITAPRPDRGWQRLGDVAAKVVAGLIGGAVPLLAAGAVLYALRAL